MDRSHFENGKQIPTLHYDFRKSECNGGHQCRICEKGGVALAQMQNPGLSGRLSSRIHGSKSELTPPALQAQRAS